jgi:uncharacterized phosphosugar-binding protein
VQGKSVVKKRRNITMNAVNKYRNTIMEIIELLTLREADCRKAASLIVQAVENNNIVHFFGTSRTTGSVAEDIFFREGSLLCYNPMFDPSLSVTHSASRSFYLDESPLLGTFLIEYYRNIKPKDVLIVIDNPGYGKTCHEAVTAANEKGLAVIAITSRAFFDDMKEKKELSTDHVWLGDMDVDLVINNYVPYGDAVIPFDFLGRSGGWVSDIANRYLLNMINLLVLQELDSNNYKADIFYSFYTDEGKAINETYIEEYYGKIKHI